MTEKAAVTRSPMDSKIIYKFITAGLVAVNKVLIPPTFLGSWAKKQEEGGGDGWMDGLFIMQSFCSPDLYDMLQGLQEGRRRCVEQK